MQEIEGILHDSPSGCSYNLFPVLISSCFEKDPSAIQGVYYGQL